MELYHRLGERYYGTVSQATREDTRIGREDQCTSRPIIYRVRKDLRGSKLEIDDVVF